jgi:hypothetical protein
MRTAMTKFINDNLEIYSKIRGIKHLYGYVSSTKDPEEHPCFHFLATVPIRTEDYRFTHDKSDDIKNFRIHVLVYLLYKMDLK